MTPISSNIELTIQLLVKFLAKLFRSLIHSPFKIRSFRVQKLLRHPVQGFRPQPPTDHHHHRQRLGGLPSCSTQLRYMYWITRKNIICSPCSVGSFVLHILFCRIIQNKPDHTHIYSGHSAMVSNTKGINSIVLDWPPLLLPLPLLLPPSHCCRCCGTINEWIYC